MENVYFPRHVECAESKELVIADLGFIPDLGFILYIGQNHQAISSGSQLQANRKIKSNFATTYYRLLSVGREMSVSSQPKSNGCS